MLPHLGQGVNQALEDAVALATLLGASTSPAGVPRALAAVFGGAREYIRVGPPEIYWL